jgi:hypothetical protein
LRDFVIYCRVAPASDLSVVVLVYLRTCRYLIAVLTFPRKVLVGSSLAKPAG